MKSCLTMIALLAFLSTNSLRVHAASLSGNDLFERCSGLKRDAATVDTGFCAGYIFAVAELSVQTGAICPANNVSNNQVLDVVSQYLDQNPAARNNPASLQVLTALALAWPCKKAN